MKLRDSLSRSLTTSLRFQMSYSPVFTTSNLAPALLNNDYPILANTFDSELSNNPVIQEIIGATMLDTPFTTFANPVLKSHPTIAQSQESINFIEEMRQVYKKEFISNGAYTESNGNEYVRKHIADQISRRDQIATDPSEIFLSEGASFGFQSVLTAILTSGQGVMLPRPYFMDFSQISVNCGGKVVEYEICCGVGSNDGQSSTTGGLIASLERELEKARNAGVDTRVLVMANPHSPTGVMLNVDQIRSVLRFCFENNLVLIVDEGFEGVTLEPVSENPDSEFVSFRAVLESTSELSQKVELFSFNSISQR